ncbi:MAG: cytochrome c peroxidase, partial [Candidatus Kapaibacterium sp.]
LKFKIIISFSCIVLLTAFSSDLVVFVYPDYFPTPEYNFEENPLSERKIQLGRALFYDPILSKDSTISCASCHSPYNAFAHTDHDLSHGICDSIGTRNAPALFNLAWGKSFMWDGAIHHLDVQALAPISHPGEMGEDIKDIVKKLQKNQKYPSLFELAFGSKNITGEHLLKAISQFQLTLVSANSKYDCVRRKESYYTDQESKGYELFKKNCNSCHAEPLFTNNQFEKNGLEIDTTLNDYGRLMISNNSKDSAYFKVPSLRNLSYTYPYMHDGRFRKLKDVLNHYTSNPSLSKDKAIELSSNDKADLIAFLLTLNDREFVFNPKHQFPRE